MVSAGLLRFGHYAQRDPAALGTCAILAGTAQCGCDAVGIRLAESLRDLDGI